MKLFKVICAKNNQKVELLVKYNSIEEAKIGLHKQKYSIIEINEIFNKEDLIWIFYFDAIIDWKIKTGQIKSNDIFRAYVKLIDDLKYNIIYIYDNKDLSEKDKILITGKIREGYEIYNKNKQKEENIKIEKEGEENNNEKIPDFLKKELNYNYNLIDKILEKINYIISNYDKNIDEDKINKLNQIYINLKQVKNITNIDKIKIIWETALLKIWELQSDLISKDIIKSKDDVLKDTNKMLKNFWSTKQIKTQENDIWLKIKNFIDEIIINYFWLNKNENNYIDKNSYIYFKTLRELNIYKQKLKKIKLDILKAQFFFQKDKKIKLQLKKKLIIQNISLIKKRLSKNKFSYVKIIKWFEFYSNMLIYFLQKIWDILIYSILIYSIFFIIFNILNINYKFNYFIIYIIVLCSILWFLFKFLKNLKFILFWIIIYIIFFVYLTINF